MTADLSRSVAKALRQAAGAPLLERPVQRQLISLCAGLGILAVHNANGLPIAADAAARAKIMAAARKDGLRPGFPDLTLIGRRALQTGFVEVKREKGNSLDPDQIWWRNELEVRGHNWALCRGTDDLLAALREWGWI